MAVALNYYANLSYS